MNTPIGSSNMLKLSKDIQRRFLLLSEEQRLVFK